jgi:type-F conjugative transfer system pilin assembly protein TrbC
LEEKKLLFVVIFLLCFFPTLLAEDNAATDTEFAKSIAQSELSKDGVAFAKEMLQKSKLDLEETFKSAKELEFLIGKPIGKNEKCKGCKSFVMQKEQKIDESNVTLVFVSFSMPKASLKELSDQCQKYGATLVIRGLHEGSFPKTKNKIFEISETGLNLDINPELFKRYNVHKVPTFVLIKNGEEVNRLSGNVTLEWLHHTQKMVSAYTNSNYAGGKDGH